MRQLSFFSAGARPAQPEDLEGLLCGPGQVVRQGGQARVSVVVLDDWRIEPLLNELHQAGFAGEVVPAEDDTRAVRTPFDRRLLPLADSWSRGGSKRPPAALVLDGPRLRWWALAAGRNDDLGYLLRVGAQDDAAWPSIGAALARAGLPAALLGPRADGPGYRLTGQRRLARLCELVGDPPDGVPAEGWPRPRG